VGRYRSTARSWPAAKVRPTGSLLISAPAATVTSVRPPNFTDLAGSVAGPTVRRATAARPKRTGRSPKVFASRIRTEVPLACRRTIMRRVRLVNVGTLASAADECGDAAQPSTHAGDAAALAGVLAQAAISAPHRARTTVRFTAHPR
jgi:hypothetical protein